MRTRRSITASFLARTTSSLSDESIKLVLADHTLRNAMRGVKTSDTERSAGIVIDSYRDSSTVAVVSAPGWSGVRRMASTEADDAMRVSFWFIRSKSTA